MKKLPYDIEQLLEPGSNELRQDVSEELVQELLEREASRIEIACANAQQLLALRAQMEADHHHEYRIALNEEEGLHTKFGTRVRLRDKSLQLVWYKSAVQRDQGRIFAKEIPRGKGSRYLSRPFNSADEHERTVIDVVENTYALIREANDSLTKIRLGLAEFQRRAIKVFNR